MLTPPAALTSLIEGNLRFIQDKPRTASAASRRRQNVDGQKPFAIILGCADSRVPVEMIFDQSLGDLFVVRVAGNIVTPSQLGSIEFAASEFGTRLVVVLDILNAALLKQHSSIYKTAKMTWALQASIRSSIISSPR